MEYSRKGGEKYVQKYPVWLEAQTNDRITQNYIDKSNVNMIELLRLKMGVVLLNFYLVSSDIERGLSYNTKGKTSDGN